MRKPIVLIIKASPWRLAGLSRNHPEYAAISNVMLRYEKRVRFVLVGTSSTAICGFLRGNVVAWDIPLSGITGALKYYLELLIILFKYRPKLTFALGIDTLVPVLAFSFLFPRSKCVSPFIGEFSYHGTKSSGKFLHLLYLKILSITLRASARNMPRMFALSRYSQKNIEKLAPNLAGRIELISYPIHSVFCPSTENNSSIVHKETLLTVAGIEQRKGLDILVKALSLIPSSQRPKLIIKGSIREPDYMKRINKLVVSLGLADYVTFDTRTNNYDELASYYQSATLFVFPTREDSLGVVILEALQCNLPVIATNVGGIPDMIENGENGILIKPNDEHELANAISFLLKDNSKREYLAKNAKRVLFAKYYAPRITLEEALDQAVTAIS